MIANDRKWPDRIWRSCWSEWSGFQQAFCWKACQRRGSQHSDLLSILRWWRIAAAFQKGNSSIHQIDLGFSFRFFTSTELYDTVPKTPFIVQKWELIVHRAFHGPPRTSHTCRTRVHTTIRVSFFDFSFEQTHRSKMEVRYSYSCTVCTLVQSSCFINKGWK